VEHRSNILRAAFESNHAKRQPHLACQRKHVAFADAENHLARVDGRLLAELQGARLVFPRAQRLTRPHQGADDAGRRPIACVSEMILSAMRERTMSSLIGIAVCLGLGLEAGE
jgi:hypothetical protein